MAGFNQCSRGLFSGRRSVAERGAGPGLQDRFSRRITGVRLAMRCSGPWERARNVVDGSRASSGRDISLRSAWLFQTTLEFCERVFASVTNARDCTCVLYLALLNQGWQFRDYLPQYDLLLVEVG